MILATGYDAREFPGHEVFCHSVVKRARKRPTMLRIYSRGGMPDVGTTHFTMARFAIPAMLGSGFKGRAIFCDATDMVCLADIFELDDLFDPRFAVQVVKHPDYVSRHKRKFIGTVMEAPNKNYPRKNWASVMLINCAHPAWEGIDYKFLRTKADPATMLELRFIPDDAIGELPPEWNVLVDEQQPAKGAKILHWTAGIPVFHHYRDAPEAIQWFDEMTDWLQHGEKELSMWMPKEPAT